MRISSVGEPRACRTMTHLAESRPLKTQTHWHPRCTTESTLSFTLIGRGIIMCHLRNVVIYCTQPETLGHSDMRTLKTCRFINRHDCTNTKRAHSSLMPVCPNIPSDVILQELEMPFKYYLHCSLDVGANMLCAIQASLWCVFKEQRVDPEFPMT